MWRRDKERKIEIGLALACKSVIKASIAKVSSDVIMEEEVI